MQGKHRPFISEVIICGEKSTVFSTIIVEYW